MKGLSKIIGGLLGFLLAGPGGCLLGVLIGHIFDKHLEASKRIDPFCHPLQESELDLHGPDSDTVTPAKLAIAYQILDISQDATDIEIKQAYRRAMHRYHPDRLTKKGLLPHELQQATQKAQSIKQAYEIICHSKDFS